MKIILIVLCILLSACATTNIDEKTTAESKTQCPIGYHLAQTAGVVIFAGSEDKNKHGVKFRCVADSNQNQNDNSRVDQ